MATATATFTANTTTVFPNPERGFYEEAQSGSFGGDLDIIKALGYRIALYQFDPLSSLGALTTNFGLARTKGMKILFRPRYCASSGCNEGRTIAQVEADALAIKPYLAANRDVLYRVQAGFIGAFGEWASSGAGLDTEANKIRVMNAVLDMTPIEISVDIRQPYFVQKQFPAVLGAAEAFTGSKQARLGNHNDCWMASPNDEYTFPGVFTVVDMAVTTTEAQQRAYLAAQGRYTGMGGETCNGGNVMRTACTGGTDGAGQTGGVMVEGPRYFAEYLNRSYSTNFHNQWISDGCYTSVENRLGYRLQLDSMSHSDAVARSATLTVSLNLRNTGWAPFTQPRRVKVTLKKSGANDIPGYSVQDLRQLAPQASSSTLFTLQVPIPPTATTGVYDVYLSAPDRDATLGTVREYAVRFANTNSGSQIWDDTNGRMPTGTQVTVS